MSIIRDKIEKLRRKREKLETLKLLKEEELQSNYVGKYYMETQSIMKSTTGQLVIITPEQICIEPAPNGTSHKKAAQKVLDNIKKNHTDIEDLSETDFGFSLSKDSNYIVIRMVPLMIGYTTICLPEQVNSFQLSKLKEFNEYVKKFNTNNKQKVELVISYSNPEIEYTDLDPEIDKLSDYVDDTIHTDDNIVYESNNSVQFT